MFEGESQSALLLGDTGSGKSLVLDRVLRSLAQEAADKGRSRSGSRSRSASGLVLGSGVRVGLGGKRKRREGGEGGEEQGEGGSSSSPPGLGDVSNAEQASSMPPPPSPTTAATARTSTKAPPLPFRVVYLNGMAQTNDAVAMREVVQQLGVTGTQGAAYSR